MEYPKEIYVQVGGAVLGVEIDDEVYLTAEIEAVDMNEGEAAIYELKKIVTIRKEVHVE